MSRPRYQQMSMEAALQEDNDEVLAMLEGRPTKAHQELARRAASPASQKPIRSMLDIAPGVPRAQYLDVQRSSSVAPQRELPSPTGSTFSEPGMTSSKLDLRGEAAFAGSKSSTIAKGAAGAKSDLEKTHKFEMLPSIEAQAMPKRVTMGGKKGPGSIFSGNSKNSSSKSKSPYGHRSQSPGTRLNDNSMNLMSTPGKWVSDSGKVIDLNNAYRRFSDAAILKSGGKLAELSVRKAANIERGEELAPDGGVRLTVDHIEDDVIESDEEHDTSDDEIISELRGRGRTRKGSEGLSTSGAPQIKSLLAAAEEDRQNQQVRSLLEIDSTDTLKVLGAGSMVMKRSGIHPRTSFDVGGGVSGISTPLDSDEEQVQADYDKAKKMTLTLSPIHSTPSAHRNIRQILRGDYRTYQEEAEQGLRRQRMYLVATDLSDEAAYALEWTVGTVLRDGDTLLAVYAIGEEEVREQLAGDATPKPAAVGINDGAAQMKEASAVLKPLDTQDGLVVPSEAGMPSSTFGRSPSQRRNISADQLKDKAEKDRLFATEEITERCIRLLRKTKLQVRVVVEVFHCKSPRQIITEVIDYLEPTLVILGSRGRSALKGVLLGSFSNYLVTKSSVPVMVARKKLRKPSKLRRTNIRLSNMLSAPGNRLAMAAIEKPSRRSR